MADVTCSPILFFILILWISIKLSTGDLNYSFVGQTEYLSLNASVPYFVLCPYCGEDGLVLSFSIFT